MALQTNTVSFKLSKRLSRPFFDYHTGTETVTFLFDTGANIPVWCSGHTFLLSAYPDARETEFIHEIRGFGKEPESGRLYLLPLFELKNKNSAFRLHNLHVMVLERPEIGCDFLICPGMFDKSDYSVTNRKEKTISFISDKTDYYCTPLRKKDGTFHRFVVWEQVP